MLSACRQLPSPTARPLWAQARQQPPPVQCGSAGQNCTGQGCGPALVRHPSCGTSWGCLAVPRAQRDHLSTLGDLICCWRHGVVGVLSQCLPVVPSAGAVLSQQVVLLARLRLKGLACIPPHPTHRALTHWSRSWSARTQKWGVALCSCALQSRCTGPGMPRIHPSQCALSPSTSWPSGNQGGQPQSPICLHSPAFQLHPVWHSHFTGP